MHHHRITEINPCVREVGLQHNDSWKHQPRRIYDHELMMCMSGEAFLSLGGRKHTIKPNSICLIPPDTSHNFWVDTCANIYFVHFDFFYREDFDMLADYYDINKHYIRLFGMELDREHVRNNPVFENGYTFPEHIAMKNPEKARNAMKSLYRAYVQHYAGWELTAKALLLTILDAIYAETVNVNAQSYMSSYHHEIVARIKEFVSERFGEALQVSDIAEHVGLSPDHTSRVFKKLTGEHLVEYIARYRLAKAKKLMLNTALALEDIALMVGFKNANYFSHTMKKFENEPPSLVRMRLLTQLTDIVDVGNV